MHLVWAAQLVAVFPCRRRCWVGELGVLWPQKPDQGTWSSQVSGKATLGLQHTVVWGHSASFILENGENMTQLLGRLLMQGELKPALPGVLFPFFPLPPNGGRLTDREEVDVPQQRAVKDNTCPCVSFLFLCYTLWAALIALDRLFSARLSVCVNFSCWSSTCGRDRLSPRHKWADRNGNLQHRPPCVVGWVQHSLSTKQL